jgi:prepilin-type N-terminal cleavage/methylation domain-containing protein
VIRRTRRRSGFTLIELLVASAIATLLMLALYSAFDLTITQTEVGRERVAHTDLARSIINRMSGDFSGSLGLLPPQSGQKPESESGSSSGDTATTDTGTADPAEETTAGALLPFQAGIIGYEQSVTLFVSKVPRALLERSAAGGMAEAAAVLPPDLKRVMYYIAPSGRGLCRQEMPWITAAGTGDVTGIDAGANEETDLIAPEVTAVSFEYLNGTGWDSVWDGASAALDDSAMMGPPRAVRVTLTFELLDDRGQATEKKVVHVFPVRAAIGNAVLSTGE